jgi:eukaryotic-like serine/threonine-protein kinase
MHGGKPQERNAVATSDRSKPADAVPSDLLPIIRNSGVLTEKQFLEVRSKVISGEYPNESRSLAQRLVRDQLLTEYQTRRFLNGKSHGLLVGKYVILDRLGSGSMGRVYKAHHQLMGRVVALKIISPEIVTNERVVARFQREMRLVGRLDHPNVVRAYDADQSNGILYIVMEYVTGRSLGQRLKEGPLAPVDAVNYAAQAALGLHHAHEQGIVHRDIKPSNLLLNDDRILKVLDLGLGVLMDGDSQATFATADGVAVGTVDYMSPEQACGRDVDGRSDLFSLGCSLYHLITGRQAFPGDTPIERLGRRINNRPVPITEYRPDLPSTLVTVLDRLLANKPQDRYQTAGEAAEALQALVKPKKSANAPAAPAPPRKPAAEAPPVPPPKPSEYPSPPPPPVVVTVRPTYPAWFLPMAHLAETKPALALVAMLGGLALAMTAGIGLGWFLFKG